MGEFYVHVTKLIQFKVCWGGFLDMDPIWHASAQVCGCEMTTLLMAMDLPENGQWSQQQQLLRCNTHPNLYHQYSSWPLTIHTAAKRYLGLFDRHLSLQPQLNRIHY